MSMLILALCLPTFALATPEELTIELGVAQVKDGNFEAALVTLESVAQRLAGDATARPKDLSRVHLYRGVAFVGLAKEDEAKASFKEALKYDNSLLLSEGEFSRRVVRVFEAARKGESRSVLYATGGIGAAVLIAGGVVLAGGVGAVALNQEGISFVSSEPPPGSTIRVNPNAGCSDQEPGCGFLGSFTMTFSVRCRGADNLFLRIFGGPDGNGLCITGQTNLGGGNTVTVRPSFNRGCTGGLPWSTGTVGIEASPSSSGPCQNTRLTDLPMYTFTR